MEEGLALPKLETTNQPKITKYSIVSYLFNRPSPRRCKKIPEDGKLDVES